VIRAVAFLALTAGVLAGAACTDTKQPPVTGGASAADSADQVLFSAEFFLTTNGIQRGDLTADTAYVLDETTRFDLRHPHVKFTSETGTPEGTMDAKHGIYSTRTQILEGWGDVVVKLVDGRTLHSPHVVYNQISHVMSSDTSYTITTPGGNTQSGIGFTSTQAPGAKLSTSSGFTSFRCMRDCKSSSSVQLPER
jgi:LPS export ABC transporter protein LptC